ncbi:hypothetical protein HanRHA438_Chr15g0729351 [Helianthus annuus]|uniref:Uncharacterized protein n=1 Tax=Helianthus annuus TaxID=4232 RepID=A0A9K3E5S9_HELAN|nr:hypothetical protein HanXRQr2_Chr15g0717221 [Helianthus annuus]KAJ0452949.1 hypothetical protein HanHA300_Chr15g0584831 [Helianthus annuus]KAJ0474865.1 hypothetical protein HanHA89_Chr15g0634611 [Helianthus annuus]KAJ0650421.1 hypothetical protein HanLR1_Chr15g0595541 [Helianthus annuus]KAJ0654182.1 hypothetical protein HanOQP8_Chr15g0592041 [Helianthus annuus]
MILDAKYPELVKSVNLLNLKPMGPGCFAIVKKNRDTAKKYQFTGRILLEKHGKFGPVIPAAKPLNATIAKEHNVQLMSVAAKTEVEANVLVTDEEGTDDDSDVEMIVPEKVKEPVRDLTLMTAENLEALIASLHDSLGNPPSVTIPSQEEQTEDAEQVSRKKQRIEPEPDTHQVSPMIDPEPVMQAEPEITVAAQETNILDFFKFNMPDTTSRSQLESSSGIRFDVGSSNGGLSEQDEAAMLVATKKLKFIKQADCEEDMDVDVAKQQRRVIVLEQAVALKDAQISSLQAQMSSKEETINQLQGEAGEKFWK